jgi:hypothetical protein
MQFHRSHTIAALAIATAAAINADPDAAHVARSAFAQRFVDAGYPEADCEALAAEAVAYATQHDLPVDAVVAGLIETWRRTRSTELGASLRENLWFARDANAFMEALRERPSLTIDSGALGDALKCERRATCPALPWQVSGMRAARRNRLRGRA